MEAHINTYKLNQNNKEYFLTTLLLGDIIRISCNDKNNESFIFSRDFTLEEIKKVDQLFNAINTPLEALDYIDKALDIQKVSIQEENNSLKVIFYVTSQGIEHQLEIPLGEAKPSSSEDGKNLIENAKINLNQEINVGQNEAYGEINTFKESAPIIGPVEENENNNVLSMNSYENKTLEQINTFENTGFNAESQFVEGTQGNVVSDAYENTYKEINNQYIEGIDSANTQYINNVGTEKTADLTAQFETGTGLDTAKFFTDNTTTQFTSGPGEESTKQFSVDNITQDLTSQFVEGAGMETKFETQPTTNIESQFGAETGFEAAQFGTEAKLDIDNQFVGGTGIDTTAQFTTGTTTTDLTSHFIEGTGSQFTTDLTTENKNITTDYQEYQSGAQDMASQNLTSQYFSNLESTTNQYTENTTTDFNGQFTTGAENLNTQFSGEKYMDNNTQFTGEIQSTLNAYTDKNINLPIENNNNQYLQSTTQTLQTTTEALAQPTQNYETPYISPADDISNQFSTGTTTNQLYQTTNEMVTTTKATTFILPLVKEASNDNTCNLINEHQLIHDKLNTLEGQMNSYKNQLSLIEQGNGEEELNKLREENRAIKQQLSELNILKKEAMEVNYLRTQLAELENLRRKVAEMDALKNQLGELNNLRARAEELNSIKPQLAELNNLRAQVAQLSMLKQQLGDLGELEKLRVKVSQIELLKNQINALKSNEQEILRKREKNTRQLCFEENTRQICVRGEIIHNNEELEFLTRKMNKSHQKITLNLIYKATVDSDEASAFHEKCDYVKSSLVLVETVKGQRFGGFTTCSWAGECIDKKDDDAFVFSLDKMETYDIIPGEEAIGCYPKFGPIFLGCQIRIYDNAFTKGGSTFEKGLNYNTEEDFELTGGDRLFNIKEIEVYEVIPQ